jgi:soluble lytic murein transglycosylase-like protein
MKSSYLILIAGLALTCRLIAGESVVLTTGYRLHADRHETAGERTTLYAGGGVIELPSASVAGFELDEEPPVADSTALPGGEASGESRRSTQECVRHDPVDIAGQAARKAELPESFVRSVMHAESNFVTSAVSPKGAIGLMQLMPGTAERLGVDPHDPQQNAEGGARYLRELLERYQDKPDQVLLALAAYNAGPGAVEKYHGVPPYRETREYILRVLKAWGPQ